MNSVQFLELLAKLRATDASFARIKVLSEMWRFVSALSPNERIDLIQDLGLEGQEGVIERFLSSPGTRSAEIMQLADNVLQKVDLGGIESAARAKMGEHWSDTSADDLVDEAESSIRSSPPAPPVVQSSATASSDRTPEANIPGSEWPEAEADANVDGPQSNSAEPNELDEEEVLQSLETSSEYPLQSDAEHEAGVPPATRPPVSLSVEQELTGPTQALSPEESVQTGSRCETDGGAEIPGTNLRESPDTAGLLQELSDINLPVARFRFIMNRGRRLRSLDCREATELLQIFPPGWMQRRVLMMFLRNGISGPFEQILDLIQQAVVRPSDYLWYAGQLFQTREISENEATQLIERSPTRSIRKRILNWGPGDR